MKNVCKMLVITLFVAGGLMLATPAKAFYFEVPQVLKNLMQLLVAPTFAEDQSFDTTIQATCMVNGVELPGTCDQYNKQPEKQPDQPKEVRPIPSDPPKPAPKQPDNNQPGQDQNQNWQPQQGNSDNQSGQNKPEPGLNEMLKNMKRGATDVSRQLTKFESLLTKFIKKGIAIPPATQKKVDDLKAMIQKFQSVTTMEEMQTLDTNDLYDQMRDLEEERRNLEQMDNIMREMGRIESSVKTFENQIGKLVKKNIPVPAEVTEKLATVKALIAEIKSGKLDNAQDIFDAVRELDESRGQMERLAQWPQTLKQMDQQIKNLDKELKRAKTIVNRLIKKGLDLTSLYADFDAAVTKLKETRAAAAAKISEDAAEAFDMVQNDFFGQMDDVMENSKIIQTMSNIGQFQSNSSREMNQSQKQIKSLKKQKIDTSELEDLLAQAKDKNAELKDLFKAQPLDPDAIIEGLSELENLRQEFGDKVAELTGVEQDMPWENAPQQFKQIQVSPGLDKLISRPTQTQTPTPTSSTTSTTSTTVVSPQ